MKEDEKNERITFRVTEDMRRQLNQVSDRMEVTVAELIRDVLHAYLIRQ